MHVPVRGDLGGEGSQTDQVRAPRDDALARLQALGYLNRPDSRMPSFTGLREKASPSS